MCVCVCVCVCVRVRVIKKVKEEAENRESKCHGIILTD